MAVWQGCYYIHVYNIGLQPKRSGKIKDILVSLELKEVYAALEYVGMKLKMWTDGQFLLLYVYLYILQLNSSWFILMEFESS